MGEHKRGWKWPEASRRGADDVYITQIGIHLQQDTIGSRTETVK